MARVMADCRRFPSEADCSLTIIGEEEEVVRAELKGEVVINQRAYLTVFRDRRPDLYSLLTQSL